MVFFFVSQCFVLVIFFLKDLLPMYYGFLCLWILFFVLMCVSLCLYVLLSFLLWLLFFFLFSQFWFFYFILDYLDVFLYSSDKKWKIENLDKQNVGCWITNWWTVYWVRIFYLLSTFLHKLLSFFMGLRYHEFSYVHNSLLLILY